MKLGDEAVLLEHNDTVKIAPNLVHPQVAAPGYAMYFLWVIRHQEGNPYIQPTFEEEHVWVEKPEAKYWPDK
jgi:5-deoxy-glucuronate isomerase